MRAREVDPIKNELLAVYTRCYSDIPPFQRPGCTEYILCRAEGVLRIIVRTQHLGEAAMRAAQFELCGADGTTARRLLLFLYENAVSVENVCDVLQDLLPAAGELGTHRPAAADALP